MNFAEIISFWFDEIDHKLWWAKDAAFDNTIRERFGRVHDAATKGELFPWRESAAGRLAEIVVLDQFSRNIYRDDPRAFAWDGMALVLAQEAVRAGVDRDLTTAGKAFLYLPYMHSESLAIHEQAERLFAAPGLEGNLDFEKKHKAIIARFGRYPHRNHLFGRVSTPAEEAFLKEPGSSF